MDFSPQERDILLAAVSLIALKGSKGDAAKVKIQLAEKITSYWQERFRPPGTPDQNEPTAFEPEA